jgi:hypothetical protein
VDAGWRNLQDVFDAATEVTRVVEPTVITVMDEVRI